MKRKNKCKQWRTYSGQRAPTCGCARCNEKYEKIQFVKLEAKYAGEPV